MLALLTASPTPESGCTLNGQPVPCDQLVDQFGGLFVGLGVLFFFLFALFFALGVFGLILTIWMIVHAAQHEIKDRAMWIVLMVLVGPIAAIIYYFVVKRPLDEQSKQPRRSRRRK